MAFDNFLKNNNKNKVGQSWIELFHGLVLKDKVLRILILQKEGMLQSGSPIDWYGSPAFLSPRLLQHYSPKSPADRQVKKAGDSSKAIWGK